MPRRPWTHYAQTASPQKLRRRSTKPCTATRANSRRVMRARSTSLTMRGALAYAIGMIEAVFGLASAAQWADVLDADPYQRVSAMYLRKIVRLEQGDWAGAEKLQRSAELLALRSRVPQLFVSSLTVEISAHALALDLAGVQDVIQRERAEAAAYPGWIPYVREAEARFELIRGDLERAKVCFDETIAMTALDENFRSAALPVWVAAQSGLCEVLIGLGRPEEARASALAALSVCEKLDIRTFSNDVVRMLALAEASLGDFTSATARLDRMIAVQNELGVTGLRMGISYEARAEVALWSGDVRAFETFAQLTAREYRHGAGCPLSARYERLTREARSRGIQPLVGLSDFEPTTTAESQVGSLTDLRSAVRDALATTQHASERYQRALRLACGDRSAGRHLYLATDAGPRLVASVDRPPPGRRLEDSVREYLEEQVDRFETQTIALNDLVPATSVAPLTVVDGVEYELALLTCTREQNAQIVGVIALGPGQNLIRDPRRPLLLSAIGEQLAAVQRTHRD
jgi:tetratricopeptide (TPR) repeat protein